MALVYTLKQYFKESRKLRYSFLLVMPLLLLYEYEAFQVNHSDVAGIRNNADVIIKQLFSFFGLRGHLAVAFLLCLFMLVVYRRERDESVNPWYFPFMIAESAVYAVVLEPLIERLRFLLDITGKAQFLSCLGAGVYEELLFRLVIFSGCLWLVGRISKKSWFPPLAAAFFSSLAFSGFHYIGNFGEIFSLDSFLYRFLAGMILCALYHFRGLGIASYTHTVYNLLVFYNVYVWKG